MVNKLQSQTIAYEMGSILTGCPTIIACYKLCKYHGDPAVMYMVNKLLLQSINEFNSHWVTHYYSLVLSLINIDMRILPLSNG